MVKKKTEKRIRLIHGDGSQSLDFTKGMKVPKSAIGYRTYKRIRYDYGKGHVDHGQAFDVSGTTFFGKEYSLSQIGKMKQFGTQSTLYKNMKGHYKRAVCLYDKTWQPMNDQDKAKEKREIVFPR